MVDPMEEMVEKLWRERYTLTDEQWSEAAPILLGMVVALKAKLPDRIELYRMIKSSPSKSYGGIAKHIAQQLGTDG
jgi:hypothetical protein